MTVMRKSFALLAIVALAACSSAASEDGPQVGPGASQEPQNVTIENNTDIDISISAAVGARRLPMGTVRARQSRSLRVPRNVNSSFRLVAEPLGSLGMSGRLFSEPIPLERADDAVWDIRPTGMTTITYRRGAERP